MEEINWPQEPRECKLCGCLFYGKDEVWEEEGYCCSDHYEFASE